MLATDATVADRADHPGERAGWVGQARRSAPPVTPRP
jgi:hypothetical protein